MVTYLGRRILGNGFLSGFLTWSDLSRMSVTAIFSNRAMYLPGTSAAYGNAKHKVGRAQRDTYEGSTTTPIATAIFGKCRHDTHKGGTWSAIARSWLAPLATRQVSFLTQAVVR